MPPSADVLNNINLQQQEEEERERRLVLEKFRGKLSDLENLPAAPELRRWIEATNGDLELSESLFRKSLDWRSQRRLEEILAWRPPRVMREFYPGGFLGYDEASSPVWLIPFGTADVRGMLSSCGKDDFLNFTIKIVEASLFLMRRRTAETGLPVTQHIFIFDLKNFSLAAATHTATIDLLRKLITIYEGNYPETLKAAYVINASAVFQFIFRVVQSSVQQKTLKKIKVFGSGNWDEIAGLVNKRETPNTQISNGGTVPQSLVFPKGDNVKRVSLEPRQRVTFCLTAVQRCQLSWTFVCDGGDIGLRVTSTRVDRKKEKEEVEELVPLSRVGGGKEVQSGHTQCQPGVKYLVSFDNTFSMIRSKTINYKFVLDLKDDQVESPSSLTEDQVIRGLRTGLHFTSTEEDPDIVMTKLF